MKVYGTTAIIARDGEQVMGTLRFYPKALCSFGETGVGFCLQQEYPAGPADGFAERRVPPLHELIDKALFVHCLMIAPVKDDPTLPALFQSLHVGIADKEMVYAKTHVRKRLRKMGDARTETPGHGVHVRTLESQNYNNGVFRCYAQPPAP